MSGIEWGALFGSSIPAVELVVRGSAIYWFLFVLFRAFLRRNVGSIAISDVLLVVLIADAAQNGMAGECGFALSSGPFGAKPSRCWSVAS